MTASKPKTTSQFVSNNTTDSLRRTQSNPMTKRPRGPINKRACQRCRTGKIKCDGDAEHGKSCSNCDPENCIYDTSPRKNKQVEQLKQRLGHLEEQLESIVQGVNDQLNIKDLQIDILCLLIDSKELFNGSDVFAELVKLTKQGNCVQQLLIFIRELLQRTSREQDRIHEIIESLHKVILCAEEVNKDPTSLSQLQSIPVQQVVIQQQQQQQQHHHHHNHLLHHHHQQQHQHQQHREPQTSQSFHFNNEQLVIPAHHHNHHQQNPNNPNHNPNPIHHSPIHSPPNDNNNLIPPSPSSSAYSQFNSDTEINEINNNEIEINNDINDEMDGNNLPQYYYYPQDLSPQDLSPFFFYSQP